MKQDNEKKITQQSSSAYCEMDFSEPLVEDIHSTLPYSLSFLVSNKRMITNIKRRNLKKRYSVPEKESYDHSKLTGNRAMTTLL